MLVVTLIKISMNGSLCAKILKSEIHFLKFLSLHENQLINKITIHSWGVGR